MKIHRHPRIRIIVYFFIIIVALSSMYLFSIKLFEVKKYDYLISSFIGADSVERSFPVNHFSNNSVGNIVASGEFLALITEQDEKHSIYVPYFIGGLKLRIDGVVVYDHDTESFPISILSSNSAIIDIPWATLNSLKSSGGIFRFTFELTPDREGLAVLSKMYVGDLSSFQENELKLGIYLDTLRIAMLGGQMSLLLLLIYSVAVRKLTSEAIAPVIILTFFVFNNLAKFSVYNAGFVFLGQLGVSIAPLAILALFKLFMDIQANDLERPYRRAYVWSGVAMLLPAVAAVIWGFDISQYNKLISAPVLLVGCLTLALYTTRSYFYSLRSDIALWSITSIITFCAVFYDVLFRFGFGLVPANFATFAMAILSISSGATFVQLILSKKLDLALANSKMQQALDYQSQVLESEFKLSLDLRAKSASAEEKERLTAELHDGVLTYLAMIKSLSEKSTDLALQRINILSRNALNEIRVILEARPSDVHSLTIALSALRAQLVDPLVYMGVEVEWSMQALLDHGATEPKTLMEIIRIVQEAVHNAVIRAECNFLSIVASRHDNGFSIIIINKGGHSFTEKHRKGLGISSMINRSSSIGATLDIQPNKSGAILTLTIPDFPSPKSTLQIEQASEQS